MDNTEAVESLAEIARSWEYSYEWGCMADEILAAIQADPLAYGIKPKMTKGVFAKARVKIFHADALRDAVLDMSENRSLTKSVKRALRAYDQPYNRVKELF